MFIDSKVARTFNYLWTIEAQLIEIKETSLSTTNMGDLSQVPVVTCLDVFAHPYPGIEAVFDLGRYPENLEEAHVDKPDGLRGVWKGFIKGCKARLMLRTDLRKECEVAGGRVQGS
jgi:hypothetical protein